MASIPRPDERSEGRERALYLLYEAESKGITPVEGTPHHLAAGVGLLTLIGSLQVYIETRELVISERHRTIAFRSCRR